MGGVTPWLGIPYPIGTDRVSDGDNAIRALAEFAEGTEWVAPALLNGFTTGTPPVAYRKDGVGNVHIQGPVSHTGNPAPSYVFVLPVGFRPATGFNIASANLVGGIGGYGVLMTGEVTVSPLPGTYLVNMVFSTRPRP